MSTSGGTSGGGGTLPVTHDDGTYTYQVDVGGGSMPTSVFDDATGNVGGENFMRANVAGPTAYSSGQAFTALHTAGYTSVADDTAPSFAKLAVDGKGLTIDANGNPVWSGTVPQLQVASVHLNTAALKTLFSAPTVIVAAAGAGKALMVSEVVAEYVATSGNIVISGNGGIYCQTGALVIANVVDEALTALSGINGSPPISSQVAHGYGASATLGSPALRSTVVNNAPLVVGADTSDPQQVGPITALAIAAPGTGYAVNDTGTIAVDQYGGGATYRVTSVAAVTGAVTGLTVTAGGTGYGVGDTRATATGGAQPGVGANLTVTPTTVNFAGDLYVIVAYQVLTLH